MAIEYYKNLENIIKQTIKPLKNIPLNLVMESISGKTVVPFNCKNKIHKLILQQLKKIACEAGRNINKTGISRARPNEVGNDIELFVKQAFEKYNISCDTPSTNNGQKKATGYPDIIFWHNKKPYYLECKTYNIDNLKTTQRTFYLSPSDNFKIIHNTVHFLVSFEIVKEKNTFKCNAYKIISLDKLQVDIKHEFNSDNKRLYSDNYGAKLLAEGKI